MTALPHLRQGQAKHRFSAGQPGLPVWPEGATRKSRPNESVP